MCWLVVGNYFGFSVKILPGLLLNSSAKESRFGSQHNIGEPFTLVMDLSHLGKVKCFQKDLEITINSWQTVLITSMFKVTMFELV